MSSNSIRKKQKKKKKPDTLGIYANEHVNIGFVIEAVDELIDKQDEVGEEERKKNKRAERLASVKATKKVQEGKKKKDSQQQQQKQQILQQVQQQQQRPISAPASQTSEKKVEFDTGSRQSKNDNNEDHNNDLESSTQKQKNEQPPKVDSRCSPSTRMKATASLQKKARPKSGRKARNPDHPFVPWNIDSKPVDRDILTIERDTKFTISKRTKGTASQPKSPPKNKQDASGKRRPQSSNNRRETYRNSDSNIHGVPWNSASELDESRHCGPRMRSTPKINTNIAAASASYEREHWKPVNQHWFSTKTALSQIWPRPEGWH